VYRANSDLLLLYVHEEKGAPDFSSNPTLELLFAKNARANHSKNASSLSDRASNNKTESVAHPTGHGNAHFEPTQQSTNNPRGTSLCNTMIANSQYIDCRLVASFFEFGKKYPTMAMLTMAIAILR
jgi:hypothetical protein